jgi:Tol biopolymer transport system component
MALAPGTRIGPYEIVAPVGAGGMGEVYRARDTRLDRDVAIKVLPERLAADPAALSRFEREAKAVAALSHPNILAIHDVGVEAGMAYSVTELLEGETLRERIGGSPLPARKALDLALQIARGLAAAHDKGVVHRDLKPDNLFVTDDGRVKILDFGLAKVATPGDGSPLTQLPTQAEGTLPGTVMGTLGYMSPEQVRGVAVDHRTDIFAFGAILFEMLSGQRAFRRDTGADTMTAILREDPPVLSASAHGASPGLERILHHCLEKNPAERFQSARDLAFHLEAVGTPSSSSAAEAAPVSSAPAARRALPLGVVAGLAAGLAIGAGLMAWLGRSHEIEPPTMRYLSYSGRDGEPTGSADGRLIVYTSIRGGRSQIWVKQVAGGDEVALTNGPSDGAPRLSPDGSQVLFSRREGGNDSVFRIPVVGGEPRKLVDDAYAADWSPDGRRIVFLRSARHDQVQVSVVGVVEASGEGAREIARIDNSRIDYPRWSPDGGTIAVTRSGTENAPNVVQLMTADGGDLRTLTPPPPSGGLSAVSWIGDGSAVVYVKSESFAQATAGGSGGQLIRQDLASGRVRTLMWLPTMATSVDLFGSGRVLLGASSQRVNLREVTASAPGRAASMRWLTHGNSVDRQPTFSPDGEWVLFSSNRSGNLDLWKVSTTTAAVRRITEDAADDWDPAFTRDGKQILWSSSRAGHFEVWTCAADGTAARQLTNDGFDAENPTATLDGEWVVYNSTNPAHPGIWKIHPDGTGAVRVVAGSWSTPDVSPDGVHVAFRTSTSPRAVWIARVADGEVLPYPIELPGDISHGRPRWLPDGRLLAFTGSDAAAALGVLTQEFAPGRDTRDTRRPLAGFDPDAPLESFGISPDGARVVYASVDQSDTLILAEGLPAVDPVHRHP